MQKTLYKTDQNNPTIQAYREAVEKGKKDQHVLPRNNSWIVKNLLSDKISTSFSDQQEAIRYAESNAAQGTAVFVHRSDGTIQERKDF